MRCSENRWREKREQEDEFLGVKKNRFRQIKITNNIQPGINPYLEILPLGKPRVLI
jgi:hypothetical protein